MTDIPAACREQSQEVRAIERQIDGLQQLLHEVTGSAKARILELIEKARARKAVAQAQLEACLAEAPSRLVVHGMELTQATQFFPFYTPPPLLPAPDHNSVPLVARKSLVVRAYVSREGETPPFPSRVTGRLSYYRTDDTGRTFDDLDPINGPVVVREAADVDKTDPDHTLNFRVPAADCVGNLHFTVRVHDTPSGPDGEFTARDDASGQFRAQPRLPVHAALIHYTGQGLDLPAPGADEFVDTLAWTGRVYPIPGFQHTGCDEVEFSGDLLADDDSGCGPGWSDLLSVLRTMRNLSDTDAVYVALLPRGIARSAGGCGDTGVAALVTGASTVMAHEIGHALGLDHVDAACQRPPGPNPDYPDYYNAPKGSIGAFGFDTVTGQVLDRASTFDYMSYCGPQWTSPYSYTTLLGRIGALWRSGRRAATRDEHVERDEEHAEQLHVRLRVHREGRAEFVHVYRIPGPPVPGADGRPTGVVIEVLGPEDRVLRVHECRSVRHHGPREPVLDLVEAIDGHPEARTLRVVRDDEIIGSTDLGDESLEVALVEQPRAARERPDILRMEWEVDGVDPDVARERPARCVLRYSNDDGASWRVVASDLTTGRRSVNTRLLPGGDRCRLQVLASDGSRCSAATTEPFAVERTPREAHLLAPRPDTSVQQGEPVVLRGAGYSPDALTAEFDEVVWSSSRDGVLGTGYELVLRSLSVGKHRITMSCPDGLGGETSGSVWIEVVT